WPADSLVVPLPSSTMASLHRLPSKDFIVLCSMCSMCSIRGSSLQSIDTASPQTGVWRFFKRIVAETGTIRKRCTAILMRYERWSLMVYSVFSAVQPDPASRRATHRGHEQQKADP